jgi:hypothetical protein
LLRACELIQERHRGGSAVAQLPLHPAHSAIWQVPDVRCLISGHDLVTLQPMPSVKSQTHSIFPERFTNILMQNSRDFSVRPQQQCNFDHEVHNGVVVCLHDPEEWI